jgi:hypothetical protein
MQEPKPPKQRITDPEELDEMKFRLVFPLFFLICFFFFSFSKSRLALIALMKMAVSSPPVR